MNTLLETKKFASMAEAVADYYKRGFDTVHSNGGSRIMHSKDQEVWIRKEGFLDYKATVIDLHLSTI